MHKNDEHDVVSELEKDKAKGGLDERAADGWVSDGWGHDGWMLRVKI